MLKRLLPSTPWNVLRILAAGLMLQVGSTGCRDSAPDDLIQEEQTTDALVFVKTDGAETLNRSWASGNLYKLSPISPDGVVTPITNFTGASISDPNVSFDGTRILFSMRPPGGQWRNIYEINADGTGLRQVTSGGGHDYDPLYLPDGRIMFTSSRAGIMDEYNHSPTENLYTSDYDGGNLERVSFNQSDDFDPELLPDGRIVYTRWEHFGNFNRFPLFFTHPDGSGTFHEFGPHNRNFFHAVPTPDGRLIAIESTEINGDAGPLAVLKLEDGPADPALGGNSTHWDRLNAQINTDGEPWPYGAFKYPHPIGGNRYVASYTLPAATADDADYALYTFTLDQQGAGTPTDPATFSINNLTFLYNDPNMNEFDAVLLAPHPKPPVIPSTLDKNLDYGVFLAQDVFNRSSGDGQEIPQRGVDQIDSIAVIAARPTMAGDPNDFSANEFEKRALIGMAPVQSDGSFRIKVPANTPISFATLDQQGRGFVVKRTHLYVRPGEEFNKCVGCHEDRMAGGPVPTNPNPMAANLPPTDLNLAPSQWTIINYEQNIGPIVNAKCVTCHQPVYNTYQKQLPDSSWVTVTDTTAAAGDLDLTAVPDTTREMRIFPRGYVNLSGESMMAAHQVVVPPFPRRSILVDYALGLGSRAGMGSHPSGADSLTAEEKRMINEWVMLGAQYK
jgi:Hydrazine synthase alpha subunit middle domain/WD40-like Beta Propeller Repeat